MGKEVGDVAGSANQLTYAKLVWAIARGLEGI